jgi:Domain of unknown function DUF11/Abnormal spindle-like microcephaly-assoc'd, ASPM-SPD-2-Hydin
MVLAPGCLYAQVTFSASQLVFPDTIQGTTSAPQSILVTNTGSSAVLLFPPSINGGGYAVSQSDCPVQTPVGGGVLAAGAGCTIQIQFMPSAMGPQSATLSIYVTDQASNFVNQPSMVLSGTGLKPPPSADLQAVFGGAFPNQVDEGGTVTLQVGMTNWGPDPATSAVLSLSIPNGYSVVSCNNAFTLAPCDNGSSTSITVATLPAFNSVTMSAVIKVPINVGTQTSATGGSFLTPMAYTISATSATGDPIASNNTVSGSIGIIPPSGISLSATALDFGLLLEHYPSSAKQITLTSVGPSPLLMGFGTGSGISIQGTQYEFSEIDDCPTNGAPLAVGGSCTITVSVNPADEGLRSATLSITDSAPGSPHQIPLSATGHPLSVGPSSLSLPLQVVNTTATGIIGLSNYGKRPVKFKGATVTGDFSVTDGCVDFADVIPAGGGCFVSVSLTATTPGPHKGTLTIFDDDVTSPQVIALSGTGSAVVVSTAPLTYPIQTVGVSSSQTVTLTNAYSAPLAVSGISASGDFSQKNDCGRALAPNSSCNITVTFSPTDQGPREGTLVLNEKDPSSPQSVALFGYGVAPIKHVYVHYDYMVLPDQGTACRPRNELPGDFFSPDCAQSQSCINNVCRGHSHAPDKRAIDAIIEAFRLHGSELHIDPHHTAIPEQATIEFGPPGNDCPNAIDPVNFYDLRAQYYQSGHKFEHYTIFGHYAQDTQEGDCLFRSGVAERPPFEIGQNFVVALGGFLDEGFLPDTVLRWQAGAFMHELGHNLGLNHGGGLFDQGELTNYKPNFISVMNYYHQAGILQADAVGSETPKSCSRDKDCGPAALCTQGAAQKFCTRYDYSDQLLPAGGPTPGVLDELGQLSEPAGLGSGRPDLFRYSDGNCFQRTAPSDGPVDWDGDGDTNGTGLTVDVLYFWWSTVSFIGTCPSGIYIPVVGHNDWADLAAIQERPHDSHSWKSNPNPQRPDEMTIEEAKARHILLPPRPVTVQSQSPCSSSLAGTMPSSITLNLLGTDDLDVSQVNLDSLRLHGVLPEKVNVADVNGDGRPDLVLIFPASVVKQKLHPNARRMTLTGSLKNSQAFWGHAETGCQ